MSSSYVERPRAYTLADLEADLLHEPESIPLPWEELSSVKFPRAGLSVISAKSGGGKTTMMLNLLVKTIYYPALAEETLYFYTYEEPASHIALKMLMLLSGVELHKEQNFDAYRAYMRRRGTSEAMLFKPEEEWKRERIEAGIQRYDSLTASGRLVLDDKMPRLNELTATLELVARRGNTAAVFVDYVQRIPAPSDYKAATRQLELAYTVQELRATAVQNGLAVITGSQVNDQGELREARDIYHEAQVVLRLGKDSGDDKDGPNDLTVFVDKQRSGARGLSIPLHWDKPTLRINSWGNLGPGGGAAAPRAIITE
jgi:replicative DNA helicase